MGEETIIIDEFYGWLAWDYLLRLLDRYPFSLDTKHGTVQCSAKKIVLTSNKHPSLWYPNSKYGWDIGNPLKRRIISIRELGTPEPVADLASEPTPEPPVALVPRDIPLPRYRNGLPVEPLSVNELYMLK